MMSSIIDNEKIRWETIMPRRKKPSAGKMREAILAILALYRCKLYPDVKELQKIIHWHYAQNFSHCTYCGLSISCRESEREISCSDIVLRLYQILMSPCVPRKIRQAIIRDILVHATNHNFKQFIRLLNPKYSPDFIVRSWALEVLSKAAKGGQPFPGVGKKWEQDAKKVLKQCKAGFIKKL